VVGLLVWWEVGCQRVWVFLVLGYSFEPHCIGSLRSYLKPNRNSLQKPIGGRSKIAKGGRSVLAKPRSLECCISVL
jgi:hypothetical protein